MQSNQFKFEEVGESITGKFVGWKEGEFKGKKTKQAQICDENGELMYIPSHVSLNAKLEGIKENDPVFIQMTGYKKIGENTAYDYDVIF